MTQKPEPLSLSDEQIEELVYWTKRCDLDERHADVLSALRELKQLRAFYKDLPEGALREWYQEQCRAAPLSQKLVSDPPLEPRCGDLVMFADGSNGRVVGVSYAQPEGPLETVYTVQIQDGREDVTAKDIVSWQMAVFPRSEAERRAAQGEPQGRSRRGMSRCASGHLTPCSTCQDREDKARL